MCIYIYIYIYILRERGIDMCIHICAYVWIQITLLKADHPERQTITLGWSLAHVRGILDNYVMFSDVAVSRSGWHRNRGVYLFLGSDRPSRGGGAAMRSPCHALPFMSFLTPRPSTRCIDFLYVAS